MLVMPCCCRWSTGGGVDGLCFVPSISDLEARRIHCANWMQFASFVQPGGWWWRHTTISLSTFRDSTSLVSTRFDSFFPSSLSLRDSRDLGQADSYFLTSSWEWHVRDHGSWTCVIFYLMCASIHSGILWSRFTVNAACLCSCHLLKPAKLIASFSCLFLSAK
jgi:prepilin signal peptidase PulO-like enzyme (type II secretory pathway)